MFLKEQSEEVLWVIAQEANMEVQAVGQGLKNIILLRQCEK